MSHPAATSTRYTTGRGAHGSFFFRCVVVVAKAKQTLAPLQYNMTYIVQVVSNSVLGARPFFTAFCRTQRAPRRRRSATQALITAHDCNGRARRQNSPSWVQGRAPSPEARAHERRPSSNIGGVQRAGGGDRSSTHNSSVDRRHRYRTLNAAVQERYIVFNTLLLATHLHLLDRALRHVAALFVDSPRGTDPRCHLIAAM